MAEEDLVSYKDISELKKDLEGMKGRKDISIRELYDAVQKLAQVMTDILEVFGAAAEQMKLEEKESSMESKKLDKLLDQNKTIAEGMVSLVELVNKKMGDTGKKREEFFKPKEEAFFKPRAEPKPSDQGSFMRPQQQEWQPRPAEITQPTMAPPIAPQQMQFMPPPDSGMQMPPMEPTPSPELDFPDEPFSLDEEPKKKGLFGMFKK